MICYKQNFENNLFLGFFQLGQHALTIGGMQEDNWFAMSANFRLLIFYKNISK